MSLSRLCLGVAVSFVCLTLTAELAVAADIYKDTNASPSQRVDDLMSKLTTDEKLKLLGGSDEMYTQPIERLGIPRLKMTDGPNGTRVWGKSTAYPAGMLLAATWDPTLAQREGEQLGRDARARGCHFLLGPGLNIYRHPQCGRNFEYFGEDPILTGAIGVGYVRGVESQNVSGTIKHFAANNQETNRSGGSSEVDERTLREIYLPAFKHIIDEAKPGALMCSYNRINGTYTSADKWLLTDVLRDEWKFDGVTMSDWGAVHEALGPINGGMDLEMPSALWMNHAAVTELLTDGMVKQSQIDEKVRRLLTLMIGRGWMDHDQTDSSVPMDNPEGSTVALDVARAGITLLKNDGAILPLDRAKHVVVVGHNAEHTPVGGGGSGYTEPFHHVTIADGIRKIAGDANVTFLPGEYLPDAAALIASPTVDKGFTAEYFANEHFEGTPAATRDEAKIDFDGKAEAAPGVGPLHFSARWKATITPGKTETYYFFTCSDDGSRVLVDGETVVDNFIAHGARTIGGSIKLEAGKPHSIVIEYFDNGGAALMQFGCGIQPPIFSPNDLATLKSADAVVACVGFTGESEGEGADRSYTLPRGQDEMLEEVIAANPKTVVTLNAGGSLDMSRWADQAAAIIHTYYGGQEGGTALADVLFGNVNPSGHLPFTVEKKLDDVPSEGHWGMEGKVDYAEGIFVGYRGFDAKKIEPRFPFGYGLTYTTFMLSDAKSSWNGDDLAVTATLTNTGKRDGAEVVQLYVSPPKANVPQAVKELKAFAKSTLKAGDKATVTLKVKRSDLGYWNPTTKAWTITPGAYQLHVGTSSRDLPITITTTVK